MVGKGCSYVVHPRSDFAPEATSPPKGTTQTPEAASDKPSRTINTTKRATRLPDDFEVPNDWITWAIAERQWAEADARTEAASFCDFWQAKGGSAAAKLDWFKTWRNWVRNSRRQNGSAKPIDTRGGAPPSATELLREQAMQYQALRERTAPH